MKELIDLATHKFDVKSLTQMPNYINFKAPLLGEGVLGCYAPSAGISILYISCKPTEDFIWANNKSWKRDDSIFFNYFLKAPSGLQAVTSDKKLSKLLINKTLLADGTQSTDKSLVMVGNEIFEFFQLSLSISLYESFQNEYLNDFSDEIKEFCYRKNSDRSHLGMVLPIESREELCIREITNCPFDKKLQSQYTELKVKELMIYYFQRMINGGVLEEVCNEKISASEKDNLISVKIYLEKNARKELNYNHLCDISNMKQDKLNKLFQCIFGYSIAKYYRTQKMQNA